MFMTTVQDSNLLFTDCQKHINDIILLWFRLRWMKMFINHLLEQNIHLIKTLSSLAFRPLNQSTTFPTKGIGKNSEALASQPELNFTHNFIKFIHFKQLLKSNSLNNFSKAILKITSVVRAMSKINSSFTKS